MSSREDQSTSEGENTCVVCFKNVEIYSIGICDHAVCFECSTRMRVLCRQNECPICRQDMPKVIFTKRIEPFSQLLPRVDRSSNQWFDKKFGLHFCSPSIQKAYYKLLEHNCQICGEESRRWPFKTFQQLKDHMRREHELFFCDLCVDNLKIFTFERRCYTRAELAHHKRKGDADNTSHRGHPLCEFCDVRYMDSDELFRHLRREHLYCHFCDADGKHQYYNSYTDLRSHFLEEHYLCEEGECKNEILTAAFRTDIDLKAHIAQVHSKHLKGAANKQARTLDIEFTLAPRPRPERGHYRQQNYGDRFSNDGAAGYDSYNMEPGGSSGRKNNLFVNPLNSDEFPSLSNSETPIPSASSVMFTSRLSAKPFSSEDFPSLGLPTRTSSVTITGKVNSIRNGDNTIFLGGTSSSRGPNVTITRTVQNSSPLERNSNNFPALGKDGASGSSTVKLRVNNSQDNQGRKGPNVSIHLNNTNGAITTRIRSAEPATVHVRPKSVVDDFPALGSKSVVQNTPQWITSKPKKDPKPSKVAPAPLLPPSDLQEFPALSKKDKSKKSNSSSESGWVNLNSVNKSKERKKVEPPRPPEPPKAPEAPKSKEKPSNSKNSEGITKSNNKQSMRSLLNGDANANNSEGDSKAKSKKKKNKSGATVENNNKESALIQENLANTVVNSKNSENLPINGTVKKRSELNIDSLHISEGTQENFASQPEDFPVLAPKKPPPGFNFVKPPPGFAPGNNNASKKSNSANITLSQPKNTTNLTFTNSSGQSYPISPSNSEIYQYHTPSNFQQRNRTLFESFMAVVKSSDVLRDFKNYSDLFRNGTYPAEKFYEHCQLMLGEKFEPLFCELVVLLPNVEKQLELYKVHKTKTKSKHLEVCSMCNQVVLAKELQEHRKNHEFNHEYPALGAR